VAETQRAGSGGSKPSPTEAEKPEVETHSVEALIEGGPAWLGYSPHLVAGALAGQRKKHLTIEEATKLTKRFAERPIELATDADADEDEKETTE
jgi:hypothetical protein